jgi:hypothetical protein
LAIPLCRWPFPRLCGLSTSGRAGNVKRPVHPLVEFRVPPEFATTHLVRRPRSTDNSLGLLLPSARDRFGSPLAAGVACAHYVPPTGFGYPLGGLLLPSPCRFYFTPAALLGFALRSFLLSEGIRSFPGGSTHMLFRLPLLPGSNRSKPGPAQQAAAPGLQPFRESLATGTGLVRQPLDAPLGFSLLGLTGRSLVPGSHPGLLPRAYRIRASQLCHDGASESFSLRLAPSGRRTSRLADGATLIGFLHLMHPGI